MAEGKRIGGTWRPHLDFRVLREKAVEALRRNGPMLPDDLMHAMGVSENAGKKILRFLDQDGVIWRPTNREPWRLK